VCNRRFSFWHNSKRNSPLPFRRPVVSIPVRRRGHATNVRMSGKSASRERELPTGSSCRQASPSSTFNLLVKLNSTNRSHVRSGLLGIRPLRTRPVAVRCVVGGRPINQNLGSLMTSSLSSVARVLPESPAQRNITVPRHNHVGRCTDRRSESFVRTPKRSSGCSFGFANVAFAILFSFVPCPPCSVCQKKSQHMLHIFICRVRFWKWATKTWNAKKKNEDRETCKAENVKLETAVVDDLRSSECARDWRNIITGSRDWKSLQAWGGRRTAFAALNPAVSFAAIRAGVSRPIRFEGDERTARFCRRAAVHCALLEPEAGLIVYERPRRDGQQKVKESGCRAWRLNCCCRRLDMIGPRPAFAARSERGSATIPLSPAWPRCRVHVGVRLSMQGQDRTDQQQPAGDSSMSRQPRTSRTQLQPCVLSGYHYGCEVGTVSSGGYSG